MAQQPGASASRSPGLAHDFVANRGQYPDGIRYVARTARESLAIRDGGWLVIARGRDPESGRPVSQAFGFELAGVPVAPEVRSQGQASGKLNFFGGEDSSATVDVAAFPVVQIGAEQLGACVRLYKSAGSFEYDLVLPRYELLHGLRIRVHGAERLTVGDEGRTIVMHSSTATIEQHAPKAWQVLEDGMRQPLDVRFRAFADDSFGFACEHGIDGLPTVVDPILYSTLLGGGSWDRAERVDQTPGRITVAGETAKDFPHGVGNLAMFMPTSPGALQPTHNGSRFQAQTGWNWPLTDDHDVDAFVAQVDPVGGGLLYGTFFGGQGNEYIAALHVDEATGRITFGGHCESDTFNSYPPGFPLTATSFQPNYIGGPIANYLLQTSPVVVQRWLCANGGWVAQLDPAMTGIQQLTYSSFYSGSLDDRVQAVFYDGQSRIYFSGRTSSGDLMLAAQSGSTPAPLQAVHANPGRGFDFQDGFLACFLLNGSAPATLDFATFFGGTGFDQITDFVVASPNRLIIAGTTSSRNLPTVRPLWGTNQSNSTNTNFSAADAFVAVIRPRGMGGPGTYRMTLDFCTYVGGEDGDVVEGLAYDPATDEVVFAGNTWSVGSIGAYPTTLKAFQMYPPSTARTCKLASNQAPASIRFLHGFVTRIKLGSNLTATNPSLRWSTFLGGAANDTAVAFLHMLDNQSLYVGGTTWATDFPVPAHGSDPVLGTNGSGSGVDCTCFGDNAADGFVVRMDKNGYYVLQGTFLGGLEDDYIRDGDGDGFGRIAVAGMTLNSGYDYTRNGAGNATGIVANPNKAFPTTANAVSTTYTSPQFLVRAHFGDATRTPVPLSTAPVIMNPLGPFESGVYNAGEAFVTLLAEPCRNVSRFQETTAVASCLGVPVIDVSLNPAVGEQHFSFTCGKAPPTAAGFFGVGFPAAIPMTIDNMTLLLDPANMSTLFVVADANGRCEVPLSLVNAPVGAQISAQFVWLATNACPSQPAGAWSASSGLTIQTF